MQRPDSESGLCELNYLGWHSDPTGLVPTDASGPKQFFFIRNETALFKGFTEVCQGNYVYLEKTYIPTDLQAG